MLTSIFIGLTATQIVIPIIVVLLVTVLVFAFSI